MDWRFDNSSALFVERLFDLTLLLAASPFILALVTIIGAIVWLTESGPIYYDVERLGRHGRPFQQWKFRTMVVDADKILENHLRENPELRDQWQANHRRRNDPRVTRRSASCAYSDASTPVQIKQIKYSPISFAGDTRLVS